METNYIYRQEAVEIMALLRRLIMINHLYKRIAIVLTLFSAMIFASINARAAGPEPAGWYAGDMHVHRSCGGSPEAVSSLYTKMSPQNLSVISLLADMGNGEVQNPVTDLPLVNGQDASVSTSGRIVHWDAEWHWDATYNQYPHQALGGHVVALGLSEAHQIWEEYTYPIFNWAHQQNGIAGFAHMEYLDNNIPQSLTCCTPIEYPVEVALGASDFISEDVVDTNNTGSGLNPESLIQAYYRLLNCGFRPGLAAGTDYPCNDGRPLGSLLTYVQVAGGQMTYRNWIEGIAEGRTVVSRNGHNEFLDLKVNGSSTPGDEIKLTGAGTVQVNIQWIATQNLSGTIELVQNGIVVASRQASVAAGAPASLTATVDFANSGWLAARRMGSSGHQVHTGAVFVTVNNAPVRASAADAEFYVHWMDNLLQKTSPGGSWSSYFVNSRSAAQARYQAAKAMYQQIASGSRHAADHHHDVTSRWGTERSYSATLTASGGTLPYTWSIASGSLPSGLSLNSSTGVISGTPTAAGTFSFTAQGTDASNPAQTATKALSITVVAAQASSTIWPATTVPGVVDAGPDSAVELGVKFRSDSSGSITGIRFYKASTNTGTHVGNLWSSSGTLLATATFTNETASGWQQVNFSTPVAITANTVYVASYHTNVGHYSDDLNYFASKGRGQPTAACPGKRSVRLQRRVRLRLHQQLPQPGMEQFQLLGGCGVQHDRAAADLSSIAVTPASQTISTGATQQFTATGTYSDGSTQNITSQATWASSNTGVATINSAGLATAVNRRHYHHLGDVSGSHRQHDSDRAGDPADHHHDITSRRHTERLLLGHAGGQRRNSAVHLVDRQRLAAHGSVAQHQHGGHLRNTHGHRDLQLHRPGDRFQQSHADRHQGLEHYRRSRRRVSPSGPATTVPGVVDSGPDSAVELGVKFRSDSSGYITGIRFYKASTNTGTHVGNLWTSSGTLSGHGHFHQRDRLRLAAGELLHPGGHHRQHGLRGLLPHQRGPLQRRPELLRGQGRGQPAAACPGRRSVRLQRRVRLRLHQQLPQPGMEQFQLLGGCGVQPVRTGNRDAFIHYGDTGQPDGLDRNHAAIHRHRDLLRRQHAEHNRVR